MERIENAPARTAGSDTSREAAEIQAAVYRGMTGIARLRLAFELSELAREFTRAGIRHRHPGAAPAEVQQEFLRVIQQAGSREGG